MNRRANLLYVAVLSLALVSCEQNKSSNADKSAADSKPKIVATNYPLYYFAQRISGDSADVVLPVPGDIDPAFWDPGENDIEKLQAADVIIRNGAGYDKWLSVISVSPSKLVDTSRGFSDQFISVEDAVVHKHGPDGDHAHEGVAFTTWLDASLAKQQCSAIAEALSAKYPDHSEQFSSNLRGIHGDLESLDEKIVELGKQLANQPVLGSHPVYQYLARRANLNMRSVHWEPDVYPDAEQWKSLEKMLEEFPARIMLWEGEPSQKTVDELKSRGVESVVYDPCGNRPDSGDLLSVMMANLARVSDWVNRQSN